MQLEDTKMELGGIYGKNQGWKVDVQVNFLGTIQETEKGMPENQVVR